MNDTVNALNFLNLAYDDYIAARHLFNSDYIIQGVTLASTAVEKYMKAVLVLNGKKRKQIGVHLDKIDKLKKELSDCYTDFTDRFDERFLSILGVAYKARYYDDLNEPISIGFFRKQFLCELDYIVAFFEQLVFMDIKDEKDEVVPTIYKRMVKERNPDLVLNNYLFTGQSKKDFMEQPDRAYCLYINPNSWDAHVIVDSEEISNKYDGKIMLVNFKFGD